jgi:hypothetical protein
MENKAEPTVSDIKFDPDPEIDSDPELVKLRLESYNKILICMFQPMRKYRKKNYKIK